MVREMPRGELGGFPVATVHDELLQLGRPSVARGVNAVHAVIVVRGRLGRIGQTTHSLETRAWVIHTITRMSPP